MPMDIIKYKKKKKRKDALCNFSILKFSEV